MVSRVRSVVGGAFPAVGASLCALVAACAWAAEEGDPGGMGLYVEEAMLLATALGVVVSMPVLIEFLMDRRKRRERIALSLEDVPVSTLRPRLAGMDDLLASIADLVDRAEHPDAYASLQVGNEILIVGGPQSGKKSLAQVIARRARFDRLLTVYNPRNADALAKAKGLITRYRREKVMLLIPGIDQAFAKEDEEVNAELEALIETTSELSNVLVVGTATTFTTDGPLDNLFGIKLLVPGSTPPAAEPRNITPRARQVLEAVARYYLDDALAAGCVLEGLTPAEFHAMVLAAVANAAEIEDIVTLCRTTALYYRRTSRSATLAITPTILKTAISRVVITAESDPALVVE
jgi:hypothetical protein